MTSITLSKFFGLFAYKAPDVPKLMQNFRRKAQKIYGENIQPSLRVEKEIARPGIVGAIKDLCLGKETIIVEKKEDALTDQDINEGNVQLVAENDNGHVVGRGNLEGGKASLSIQKSAFDSVFPVKKPKFESEIFSLPVERVQPTAEISLSPMADTPHGALSLNRLPAYQGGFAAANKNSLESVDQQEIPEVYKSKDSSNFIVVRSADLAA